MTYCWFINPRNLYFSHEFVKSSSKLCRSFPRGHVPSLCWCLDIMTPWQSISLLVYLYRAKEHIWSIFGTESSVNHQNLGIRILQVTSLQLSQLFGVLSRDNVFARFATHLDGGKEARESQRERDPVISIKTQQPGGWTRVLSPRSFLKALHHLLEQLLLQLVDILRFGVDYSPTEWREVRTHTELSWCNNVNFMYFTVWTFTVPLYM